MCTKVYKCVQTSLSSFSLSNSAISRSVSVGGALPELLASGAFFLMKSSRTRSHFFLYDMPSMPGWPLKQSVFSNSSFTASNFFAMLSPPVLGRWP